MPFIYGDRGKPLVFGAFFIYIIMSVSYVREIDSEFVQVGYGKRAVYLCNFCNKEFVALCKNVKSKRTNSCGCVRGKGLAKRTTTHGLSKTTIYTTWRNMMGRCYNKKFINYDKYGGVGISVCERWHTFENFYADVSPSYKDGLTIDRYPDKQGNYEPNNFRWATYMEQNRNLRSNVIITMNGKTQTMQEWINETGVASSTFQSRYTKYGANYDLLTMQTMQSLQKHRFKFYGDGEGQLIPDITFDFRFVPISKIKKWDKNIKKRAIEIVDKIALIVNEFQKDLQNLE